MNDNKKYEIFKLQWMLDHGYTLSDLIHELQLLQNKSQDDSIKTLFDDWEYGYGFGSEIWPCYEEWLDCEGSEN